MKRMTGSRSVSLSARNRKKTESLCDYQHTITIVEVVQSGGLAIDIG